VRLNLNEEKTFCINKDSTPSKVEIFKLLRSIVRCLLQILDAQRKRISLDAEASRRLLLTKLSLATSSFQLAIARGIDLGLSPTSIWRAPDGTAQAYDRLLESPQGPQLERRI
jgi:hypothetical protein